VGWGYFGSHTTHTIQERENFLQEVADAVDQYGLDGVDFDDEWPSSGSYSASTTYGAAMANLIVSTRRWLGPDKAITMYDWNAAQYMSKTLTVRKETSTGDYYPEDMIPPSGVYTTETSKPIADFYNYTTYSAYGNYEEWGYGTNHGRTQAAAKSPTMQYAPLAVGCWMPSPAGAAAPDSDGLKTHYGTGSGKFMNAAHNGSAGGADPYGATMWYNLRNRAAYQGNQYWKFEIIGNGITMPEHYFSVATNLIFGLSVIYQGNDYSKDY
jgi:hypothetical protein